MGKFLERYKRKLNRSKRKASRMERNARYTPMPKIKTGGVIGEGNMGTFIYLAQPGNMTPSNQVIDENKKKKKND